MSSEPIRLVIFDCDGVLVDSEPIAMRVLLKTLSEAGLSLAPEDAHALFLGKSLASISAILGKEFGLEVKSSTLEQMRRHLYEAFRLELQAVPGVARTLQELRTATCVASSSQLERIHLALKVTGLLHYFEPFIYSATMVAEGKPAPDLFLHAARQMRTDPRQCLVIEDSPAGIEAAVRAGMRVYAFVGASHATGSNHREIIKALGPAQIFANMRELPSLLNQEMRKA
jgi:HAD superfamily hydrolase (TIGR01509 family)